MDYWSHISSVFSYPFREGGWAKFSVVLVMSTALICVQILPIVGWLALLFCGLYFMAAFLEMIRHTSEGVECVPHWPVMANFREEVMMPLFRFFVTIFAAFWPAICCFYRLQEEGWGVLLLFAGAAYFPMALLRVIVWESLGELNPWKVFKTALRMPLAYLFCVVLFAAAVCLPVLTQSLLQEADASLAWRIVLPLALLIYLTMVFCFSLGRLCVWYGSAFGILEDGEE